MARHLQEDGVVVLQDFKHLALGVVIVCFRLQAEGADAFSVIHSGSFQFIREASVVFFVMVQSDHDLPLGFVLRDTPEARTSVVFVFMFSVLSQFLDTFLEDNSVVSAVFKFLDEFSSFLSHELIGIDVFLRVSLFLRAWAMRKRLKS